MKGISPMKSGFRKQTLLLFPVLLGVMLSTQRAASAPPLRSPVLCLIGTEAYQPGGKQFIPYDYDVLNKDSYPAETLAPAPSLPPPVANTKASRPCSDIV